MFTGTGNPMTVSTCFAASDFPHNIFIQTACSGNMTCIRTESPNFSPKCNTVNGRSETFDSVADQVYYVIVEGSTTMRTGKFEIAVWEYPAAAFDVCDELPALLVVNNPIVYTGSTNYAKLDTVECTDTEVTGRGVWHIFGTSRKASNIRRCSVSSRVPSTSTCSR